MNEAGSFYNLLRDDGLIDDFLTLDPGEMRARWLSQEISPPGWAPPAEPNADDEDSELEEERPHVCRNPEHDAGHGAGPQIWIWQMHTNGFEAHDDHTVVMVPPLWSLQLQACSASQPRALCGHVLQL